MSPVAGEVAAVGAAMGWPSDRARVGGSLGRWGASEIEIDTRYRSAFSQIGDLAHWYAVARHSGGSIEDSAEWRTAR